MMILYAHVNRTSPNTLKLRAALAEAGARYEYRAVDLDAGEQKRPAFLALNPHGKIPVLVDGDFVLAESDAILWYIGERHPAAPLLPSWQAPGGREGGGSGGEQIAIQARARVAQWCAFSSTGLYQTFLDLYIHTVRGTPETRVRWIGEAAAQKMDRLLAVMDGVLARLPYLAGDFSLADLAAAAVLQTVKTRLPVDRTTGRDAIADWYGRVTARPAWQRALEDVSP